jgi:hypothetical protein
MGNADSRLQKYVGEHVSTVVVPSDVYMRIHKPNILYEDILYGNTVYAYENDIVTKIFYSR